MKILQMTLVPMAFALSVFVAPAVFAQQPGAQKPL